MAYKLGDNAIRQLQGLFRTKPAVQRTFHRPALALEAAPPGIQFYNDSGETIPAYAIMAVTGYRTDRFPGSVLTVSKPSTTFKRRYLINGPYDVPYQGDGQAQTGLLQKVLYDTGTPANGEGWGPKPSQWTLSKNYPQTCVVDGIYDSTAKIMLATLGVIEKGLGKANGTIANEGSGGISIWAGAGLWTTDITGMDPTAVNLGPPLASGDKVQWDHLNGTLVCSKICAS